MIIFDLDGVLANCEHRRYFVDRFGDHPDYYRLDCLSCNDGSHHKIDPQFHKVTNEKWQPDWTAYNEACDKDEPIWEVIQVLEELTLRKSQIQIWCGRCESFREKTENWLKTYINYNDLKMRPIGDTSPDWELKRKWLNELAMQKSIVDELDINKEIFRSCVDFVFDADPDSIAMYRRRGIFVFDCNQRRE